MSDGDSKKPDASIDGRVEPRRFAEITFDDFRKRAVDPTLSNYEKIGFPDAFRKGWEGLIFSDICSKMPALSQREQVILDIGPGCSDLPHFLIEHCEKNAHRLILMDSYEMLSMLPNRPFITKVPGRFPNDRDILLEALDGGVDAIIVYSVFQHVYIDSNPFRFLDELLSILNPGGQLLIGDIPNSSKLKRFLSSKAGALYHKRYMRTDSHPHVEFNNIDHGRITDAVVFSLLERARTAGFDAYIVPQSEDLPMQNRREDIYIRRP